MLIAPIIFILIGMFLLITAGYCIADGDTGFGAVVIFMAVACLVFSTGILVSNVTNRIDEEVKATVLQHLTYTNDVTLTPDSNGTFFYELDENNLTDLFDYITTDRNNNLREVE